MLLVCNLATGPRPSDMDIILPMMLARHLAGIISHLAASSNCLYRALILFLGTHITPPDKSKSKPSQLI